MNPDLNTNPGYGECASTCCSGVSTTNNTAPNTVSDVVTVLESQCDLIEEMLSQLDRNSVREDAVRSKLMTLLANLITTQHTLEFMQ